MSSTFTHSDAASDVPALARGVVLVGAMPGVNFTQPQFLVQRNGSFIQLSELLYRLLQHIDGRRTVQEIADDVTNQVDWIVTPDAVRAAMTTKLLPLGLIASDSPPIPGNLTPSTLLSLRMRMQLVGPAGAARLTSVLQYLFSPIAIVTSLLFCAGAHWWLYETHGLREAVSSTLQQPGGLLATVGILVAGALFHEVGHAAALRYGGGDVRGIGGGLYLLFPAFYTDVTDVYRLPRTARVRTDLGGVYFHFLYATALIAASVAFDAEVLLFAAFLINLEIARQFIPFVRLDGYWLLADISGIPDFFSQMGPFLRGELRRNAPGSSMGPRLTRPARIVFLLYATLALPVLAYLTFLMVRALPIVLHAGWSAFLAQVQILSAGEGWWISVLALTQIVLLILPFVGTALILAGLVSLPLAATRLGKGRNGRRVVTVLGFTGSAAVLLLSFAAAPGNVTPTLAASPRAQMLVADTRKAIGALNTLEADFEGVVGPDRFTGRVTLKRPNLARVEVNGSEGLGSFQVNSDGRQLFAYFPADNQLTRSTPGSDGRNINPFVVEQVRQFFRPDRLAPQGSGITYLGRETLGASTYDVLQVRPRNTSPATRYYISPEDRLIHRVVFEGGLEPASWNWTGLTRVRTGIDVPDSAFHWTPPVGATSLQLPVTLPMPGAGAP